MVILGPFLAQISDIKPPIDFLNFFSQLSKGYSSGTFMLGILPSLGQRQKSTSTITGKLYTSL